MHQAWWWLGAVLVVVVAVDQRLAHRAPRARRRPVRRPGGGGSGAFGELVAGFQPNVRHLHEEQERQRHDLVTPGDADPTWDLDLDALTARRTTPPAEHEPTQVPSSATPVRRPLTAVAPGVWVTTAQRWTTVTTIVVADDGTCLVVDPGITVDEVEGLAAELAARGWAPVAGFSTHPHWDHVLWSASLGDVRRWATAEAAEEAREHLADLARSADVDAPGHDHGLTGRLTPLPDGSTAVPWTGPLAIVVPYSGHCRGSAALLLPGTGVLIAGDVLSDVEVPLLDLDARDPLGDYRATLDAVEVAAQQDVRVLVPGHGSVGDAAELARRVAADRTYLGSVADGQPCTDRRLSAPDIAAQHAEQVRRLHP